MDHRLTPTERAVDAILAALEDNPASIREGTDPMVLLYWWKRDHADTAMFMRAMEDLTRDGLVIVGPPPERRLRLSTHGFAWLDARLPVDENPDAEAEAPVDATPEAGAHPLTGGTVASTERLSGPAPVAERIAAVERLFATLDLPPGRGIEAGTLLRIWQLDGHPGSELRETLDIMALTKRLRIDRGARTTFALMGDGHGHG